MIAIFDRPDERPDLPDNLTMFKTLVEYHETEAIDFWLELIHDNGNALFHAWENNNGRAFMALGEKAADDVMNDWEMRRRYEEIQARRKEYD